MLTLLLQVNQLFISQLERVLGKEAVKVTSGEVGENLYDRRRHMCVFKHFNLLLFDKYR